MPKNILILGHGAPTQVISSAVRGEMTNAKRLKALLKESSYHVHDVVDILELFGSDVSKLYEPLAHLNLDLAKMGHEIIGEMKLPEVQNMLAFLLEKKADIQIILSWVWSVAALFATGIHKKRPTITKLYVHQENEIINRTLYEPSDLLITESLLANKKAIEFGIPPWKILFLPNTSEIKKIEKKNKSEKRVVIGSVSRLECGKNIEFALDSAKKIHDSGRKILFVLKGKIEEQTFCPDYRDWLKELVTSLKGEEWFFWDDSYSPFEEMHKIFSSFDIFLHLSGSEAGSNVIIESMSMGLPTVILNASNNPFLYQDGAYFIENDGVEPNEVRPFSVPDKEDLFQKLLKLVDSEEERQNLAQRGYECAQKRFSKERILRKLPLAFKAASAFHMNRSDKERMKYEMEEEYKNDCKLFGITP